MASEWQENQTWKSGLFTELPVSRWQEIRGSDSVGVVILKKRKGQSLQPTNLQYQLTLNANTSAAMVAPFFYAGQFVCIAVDMRRRSIDLDCAFATVEHVQGSLRVHITYQVLDAKTVVVDVEDALGELRVRCQSAVGDYSETRSYKTITSLELKQAIKQTQLDDLGLAIRWVTASGSITWPKSIVEPISKMPAIMADAELTSLTNRIKIDSQSEYNKLLENKLREMRITHPAILMRVLAKHDQDYQTILEAAQHFSDSQKDSQIQAKEFLVWLINNDKVPRIELEELISGLVGRVTDDITATPDAVNSLLTAPAQDTSQIPDLSHTRTTLISDISQKEEDSGGANMDILPEQENDWESSTPGHSVIRRRTSKTPLDATGDSDHSYTRYKRNPKA